MLQIFLSTLYRPLCIIYSTSSWILYCRLYGLYICTPCCTFHLFPYILWYIPIPCVPRMAHVYLHLMWAHDKLCYTINCQWCPCYHWSFLLSAALCHPAISDFCCLIPICFHWSRLLPPVVLSHSIITDLCCSILINCHWSVLSVAALYGSLIIGLLSSVVSQSHSTNRLRVPPTLPMLKWAY